MESVWYLRYQNEHLAIKVNCCLACGIWASLNHSNCQGSAGQVVEQVLYNQVSCAIYKQSDLLDSHGWHTDNVMIVYVTVDVASHPPQCGSNVCNFEGAGVHLMTMSFWGRQDPDL